MLTASAGVTLEKAHASCWGDAWAIDTRAFRLLNGEHILRTISFVLYSHCVSRLVGKTDAFPAISEIDVEEMSFCAHTDSLYHARGGVPQNNKTCMSADNRGIANRVITREFGTVGACISRCASGMCVAARAHDTRVGAYVIYVVP